MGRNLKILNSIGLFILGLAYFLVAGALAMEGMFTPFGSNLPLYLIFSLILIVIVPIVMIIFFWRRQRVLSVGLICGEVIASFYFFVMVAFFVTPRLSPQTEAMMNRIEIGMPYSKVYGILAGPEGEKVESIACSFYLEGQGSVFRHNAECQNLMQLLPKDVEVESIRMSKMGDFYVSFGNDGKVTDVGIESGFN